jgi:hypothetical protein
MIAAWYRYYFGWVCPTCGINRDAPGCELGSCPNNINDWTDRQHRVWAAVQKMVEKGSLWKGAMNALQRRTHRRKLDSTERTLLREDAKRRDGESEAAWTYRLSRTYWKRHDGDGAMYLLTRAHKKAGNRWPRNARLLDI